MSAATNEVTADQVVTPEPSVDNTYPFVPALVGNVSVHVPAASCVVTNSYNQAMLRILPHMGVAVNVFPRLEHDGKGISASEVRRMLDAKNFEGIQRLVPPTTFTYLKSRDENVPQGDAPLD